MNRLAQNVVVDSSLPSHAGSETAVRIYLDEIISLSSTALNSQNWNMKAQAANTMSSVAKYQKSQKLEANHIHRLLNVSIKQCCCMQVRVCG